MKNDVKKIWGRGLVVRRDKIKITCINCLHCSHVHSHSNYNGTTTFDNFFCKKLFKKNYWGEQDACIVCLIYIEREN